MKAYDCNHNGKMVHLTGNDDEELFRKLKDHLAEVHSDLSLADDEIRQTLADNAYDE